MGTLKFNQELFDRICEDVATTSQGLQKICNKHGVSSSAFYVWIKDDKDLLDRYTRAREQQADLLADEIIEIADDGTNDTKTIRGKDGSEIEVEDTEWTNRSKLRVEARKWIAAKLKPKKYGDRLDHDVTVKQEQPLFPPKQDKV